MIRRTNFLVRFCFLLTAILGGCDSSASPQGEFGPIWDQLDAGTGATCGVQSGGAAFCWGEGWTLGKGREAGPTVSSPREVAGNHRWRTIEVGRSVACGVTLAGPTLCWGPPPLNVAALDTLPTPLKGDPGFQQLTVGDTHACGLTAAGVAYCWGDGSRGQVGRGHPVTTPPDSAVPINGSFLFAELRAGPESTCGVLLNGDLACWGGSEVEGDGYEARIVQTGYVFSGLAYGGNIGGRGQACADSAGTVLYCVGYEPHASLPQPIPVPVTLPGNSPPAMAAVGGTWLPFLNLALPPNDYNLHACSSDSGGRLWCWGSNPFGQIGDGTASDRAAPTEVSGLAGITQVTTGGIHTCAVDHEGIAWCWGGNQRGQLGIGSVNSGRLSPRKVRPP